MYIIRNIFQLKFGHAKEAVALLKQVMEKDLLPQAKARRALTDFTGDSYRLILEEGFESLAEYEGFLTGGLAQAEWQQWYGEFKQHVESSCREILREVAM